MKITRSEIVRIMPIVKRRIGAKFVAWVERLFSDEKLKKDIFGTKRERRALICYLPEAFEHAVLPKYHSNFTECHIAAECLDTLGFSVDCASRNKKDIDYSRYDVVFGINCPSYWQSFAPDKQARPLRIFYSVGAHTFYNFEITAKRSRQFFADHGFWLSESYHYIPGNGLNYYEACFSDAVICLGDDFVTQQFTADDKRPDRYFTLPAFYFPVKSPDAQKDFSRCRNNILWFGSSGMVHKGLDIAIDFAARHKEFTLHICGGNRQERNFWRHYMPIIEANDNITYHGFVDIESDEFARMLDECGLLLNPSLSESGAVSVLNVLGNGALLPVYSQGTALNLSACGIEVPEADYPSFEAALLQAASLPVDIFSAKAWEAHKLVKEKYTIERYKQNLHTHLSKILKKYNK